MNIFKRFWGILSGGSYTVKRASALLAFTALLSNILGLLRNLIFYALVPKPQLDVYFSAFTIPNFLFNIVIFGAVSSAFVPIASELLVQKKDKETYELTNQLLTWLTIFFTGVSIILLLTMSPIMHGIAHRFDASRLNESIMISRILLLQSIFFAWSFTVGGFLNSSKRYVSYALAPLLYNIVIIVGGVLAVKYGIVAIAWSVVVGAFAHFAIQFKELLRTPYRPHWDIRITPRLKEIGRLMLPRSLSQGTAQLVDGVYTFLGAGLLASSITIFNAMNDIQTMPIQIVGNAIAVAVFPSLSAHIAENDTEAANSLLNKALRATLFILIPAIAYALVVRAQIVRLYFGLGHSNLQQITLGISTLVAFLIGVIPACFVAILSRVFYALKDTRTPMILSALSAAIAIFYAIEAIAHGGTVVDLAIAESILMTTQCVFYGYALYRNQRIKLGIRGMSSAIVSYLAGAVILSVCTWEALRIGAYIYSHVTFLGNHVVISTLFQLIVATVVGGAVFVIYSRLIHKEELQWILHRSFTSEK